MKREIKEKLNRVQFNGTELVDEFILGMDLEDRFHEARQRVQQYQDQFIIEGETPKNPVDDLVRRIVTTMLLGLSDAENYIREGIKALEPSLRQAATNLACAEVLKETGMASDWQYGDYEGYFKDIANEVLELIDDAFALVPDAHAFDKLVSEVNKAWPDDELYSCWWTLEVENKAAWSFYWDLIQDLKNRLERFGVPDAFAAVADVCHCEAILAM